MSSFPYTEKTYLTVTEVSLINRFRSLSELSACRVLSVTFELYDRENPICLEVLEALEENRRWLAKQARNNVIPFRSR